jgi:hypothetical protein
MRRFGQVLRNGNGAHRNDGFSFQLKLAFYDTEPGPNAFRAHSGKRPPKMIRAGKEGITMALFSAL